MKLNFPISIVSEIIYLQKYMFFKSSKTLGLIDYREQTKTKKYIPINIDIMLYTIVHPIIIKDIYTSIRSKKNKHEIIEEENEKNTENMQKDEKDYSKYFDDSMYETRAKSNEEIKNIFNIGFESKHNHDIFIFTLKGNQIHLYSEKKLFKTISIGYVRFNSQAQKKKRIRGNWIDILHENLSRSSGNKNNKFSSNKTMNENFNFNNLLFSNAKLKEIYFECLFKKNGLFTSYHESMPKYLFVIIYDCDDLILEYAEKQGKKSDDIEKKVNGGNYFNDLIGKSNKQDNKIKVLTFEIFSGQVLSIDIIKSKAIFELPGILRLFKNFKNILVKIIFIESDSNKEEFENFIRIQLFTFDKYNGFIMIYQKDFNFFECSVPYYDILYTYTKGKGEEDLKKYRKDKMNRNGYNKGKP